MRVANTIGAWVVLCGVAGAAAYADDGTANFALTRGASCLTADTLEPRIEHWLGRALPREGAAVQLRVSGSPDDPRSVVMEVWVGGEKHATRTFAPGPPRCEDLVEAVALTAAMMLQSVEEDAWRVAPETEAQAEAAPSTPPPPVPASRLPDVPEAPTVQHAEAPPAPAASEATARRPPTVAVLGAGLLARPATGGSGIGSRLDFGLRLGSRSTLRASFTQVTFPSRPLDDIESSYVSHQLAGRLEVCAGSPHARRFRLAACLGGGGGRLRVKGRDVAQVQRARTGLPLLGGGLELALRLRPGLDLAARLMLEKAMRSVRVAASDSSGSSVGQTRVPSLGANFGLLLRHALFAKRSGDTGMNPP